MTPPHRVIAVTFALAPLALGACGGGPPILAPPPVPPPAIEVDASPLAALIERPVFDRPDWDERVDELLASPLLRDPDFRDEVDTWVGYWRRTAAPWFPEFIRRMGHFEQTVDSALAENELPASLRYLPLIESGYAPAVTSHASAVGLWQFMAPTARGFGMRVDGILDERRNPYRATDAAVEYLSALHGEFGSWFLALAAYNSGPTRTRRILRREAPLAARSDSLYWSLRHHFPLETRQFVPKLLAAAVVAGNPSAYGYDVLPDPPLAFDEVEVPDATSLDIVARAAGASEREIVRLNPELIRGLTPPGRSFTVRVPTGQAAGFTERYAMIPENERVSIVEHTVASGETLSHIAQQYRVSVADLTGANPDVRPRYLKIGARLTVPVALSVRSTLRGGGG